MTLEEFLRWDDGTDTRYELINGFPMAMAPPARAHGILCARLAGLIDAALHSRRPCAAQIEAGIARPDHNDSFYIADIAVSCRPYRQGEQLVEDPILIVEILSPSTERNDRRLKLPAYQELGSVREIVLIDADSHHAEVYRREGARWGIELARGAEATLSLATVELHMSMAELYNGIATQAVTDER
ncbi:MAG TPA: Uma2 family endonuclease [Stellaceae bacterium]|nr:Uma2 family endonuclease [Stellaceae bacterium]